MKTKIQHTLFIGLLVFLLFVFILNISVGQVIIPFKQIINSFLGNNLSNTTWQYIILNYRLPKAITAVLVGFGLSISGLQMQTLFKNPLAGPYVLGLNSGSSLMVAILIMGASFLPNQLSNYLISEFGIILASCLGSFLVFFAIILIASKIRNTASILIVGLMFSSFAGALISTLSFFSTAEQLQKYTFWSMGSLANLSWFQVLILFVFTFFGLLISLFQIKALNALLLGENYAKSAGLNYNKAKYAIIFATSILTGSITAFVGPIAFVGLAVPHLAKLIFKTSNHKTLFFATLLLGGILMLLCDLISQLPTNNVVLPINSITSLFGAPVVIYLLLGKNKVN